MRILLAGTCALALGLSSALAVAQTSNQTPAATAAPPTAEKPAPGADGDAAGAEDGGADEGGAGAAGADDAGGANDLPPPLAFEDGELTVTQPEEYGDKILSYDGKEIARDYFVLLDKVVEVAQTKVAIFDVGPGGNACGPAALLIWKPKDGDLKTETVGEEDCGAPPPAVADENIIFAPYLLPGESAPVKVWSPDAGLTTFGQLRFVPEPGTDWKDIDAAKLQSLIDAFRNEAVYKASEKLLGDKMTEVVLGLSVSGGPETGKSGAIYASGCTPHACGIADTFMAIDKKNKALYFAHQGDKGVDAWPAVKKWPADLREAMNTALTPPN